jgi:hypothetical protein
VSELVKCAWCGRERPVEKLIPPLLSPGQESRWGAGRCVLPDPACVRRLSGGGERPQPKTVNGVEAWIGNSAQHNLQRENELAARCASSYRTEPYKGAAERLAEAHRKCAAIWQSILDDLGGTPR